MRRGGQGRITGQRRQVKRAVPPRARFRARRRTLAVAAVVTGIVILADHRGWLLARPDDMATYHGREAPVVGIVDGETIEIAARDALADRPTTRLRLWGLDCPRAWAGKAAELARSMVGGRPVVLCLEPHRTRGSFGRLLAHVSLPDGSSLNEALLAAGLARADDRWPHAMLRRYAQLERAAQREGAGMWAMGDE